MAIDPQILQHRDWLGLLQPVGLVVSPVALVKAQAVIDRNRAVVLQPILQGLVSGDVACVADFADFAQQVLGGLPEDLVTDLPESLSWGLTEYEEVLSPSFGVRDPDSGEWILLVQEVAIGLDLDATVKEDAWRATSEEKFERLLREVKVSAGILWNGEVLRLVYAPRGESSGHVTFPIAAMTEVAGRSILAALDAVLGGDRLFNVPSDRRLSQILINSRAYQSEVSEKLADQVVDALWALLKGFQMADSATNGTLLKELDAAHLYGGLITTLMRLVFLLYAEDEGLMPNDSVYQRHYAVTGLYEQLREDDGNYPDTMDDRYGAWAGLLSLFGLVYEGGGATEEYLPARHGQLFDPREFAFLAGFGTMPRIPDGVIYRVLDKLLMLDGERLSYRSLDVEQIGSVYEGIMGYTVERSASLSIGVNSKPKGSKVSTTVVVDAGALLAEKGGERSKRLKEWANCELATGAAKLVKEAKTIEDLVAGLGGRVSRRTPDLLTIGALYLQPTEERRRSGSHYTPRALTAPIVETTLQPVLAQLGEMPTAEQILNLKVCDLAMGSGAFLVEVCRQLAEKLVEAWGRESLELGDLEPLLLARRLIAQRCLYGVDRNPFAVNLAKLSLWLVTLSKDSPFTFLDHALKCGDSLVGLSRSQILNFGRDPIQDLPLMKYSQEQVLAATMLRSQIQSGDTRSDADAERKSAQLQEAEAKLTAVRMQADVAIAAFFDGCGKSKKDRESLSLEYGAIARQQPERMMEIADRLRNREKAIVPFNWEIEFPEVFNQKNGGGFDAIVGNPPFAGKNTITNGNAENYLDYLKEYYAESHGNSDLVAYFFRKSFELLKPQGTIGLIATNTIAQGDTRSTGLRFICNNGGMIYNATRRYKWPGLAAVVVSVVHIMKVPSEDRK